MAGDVDSRLYDESRAIRLVRDRIIEWAPKLETSPYTIQGFATAAKCPGNPKASVPLWAIFGMTSNHKGQKHPSFERLVPNYKHRGNVEMFQKVLCELAVIFTEGDYVDIDGHAANGCFRRDPSGADAIQSFGTTSIIALPYGEVLDKTTVAYTSTSHELRHAFDDITRHWSLDVAYTSASKDPELYFSNPAEIRARVTEVTHSADDVIHDLVRAVRNTEEPEYQQQALHVLTEIFGSGVAVFSSWLYGMLTPFHKGESDLPRPTMDVGLLQTLLRITAGAYAPKMSRKVNKSEQLRIQNWMADYSKSVYFELVKTYRGMLPASVFHNDAARTQQLMALAHKNLRSLQQELPNLTW